MKTLFFIIVVNQTKIFFLDDYNDAKFLDHVLDLQFPENAAELDNKTQYTLPCDPTAISWLEEDRLRHDAQCGKEIFLVICH